MSKSLSEIAEDVSDDWEEDTKMEQQAQNDKVLDEEIDIDDDDQLRDVQEEYDGGWDTAQ